MKALTKLKRGKAADIFGLSAKHVIFSHPVLSVVLARLFRLILLSGYVPQGFKISYIVPIPKPMEFMSKSLSYNDFRGIAVVEDERPGTSQTRYRLLPLGAQGR